MDTAGVCAFGLDGFLFLASFVLRPRTLCELGTTRRDFFPKPVAVSAVHLVHNSPPGAVPVWAKLARGKWRYGR
jgi:hypothetical protein